MYLRLGGLIVEMNLKNSLACARPWNGVCSPFLQRLPQHPPTSLPPAPRAPGKDEASQSLPSGLEGLLLQATAAPGHGASLGAWIRAPFLCQGLAGGLDSSPLPLPGPSSDLSDCTQTEQRRAPRLQNGAAAWSSREGWPGPAPGRPASRTCLSVALRTRRPCPRAALPT